jgi:pyridinium-3,5-bisthiocarboxylic acid mononucleotide nickel chelatase
MTIDRIGSGAGGKDFPDCPNILRAFLGTAQKASLLSDEILIVETNIDDSTAEVLGYVMERLLEQGALDVYFTPIQMKKQRPATMLSFLCLPGQLDSLSALVLEETSAIGLRYYPAGRVKLERRIEERETCYGKVRFKLIGPVGGTVRITPEYDDCRRIAAESGAPLQQVMLELSRIGRGEQ